jgi:hypothetical protein
MVLTDDLQAIAAAEWASEVGIESVYVLHDTKPTGAVSPNRSPVPATSNYAGKHTQRRPC